MSRHFEGRGRQCKTLHACARIGKSLAGYAWIQERYTSAPIELKQETIKHPKSSGSTMTRDERKKNTLPIKF